jgi:integrase
MAGQIIKRGESTWLVRVFDGRDAKNKRRYLNKTIRGTKKDAQKYLNQQLRNKDLGLPLEQTKEFLDDFLDRWLADVLKGRVRANTYSSYAWILGAYIRPTLGSRKVPNIKAPDIQRVYAEMREKGLSARTIRYAHAVLSSALGQAVKWNMLVVNPCRQVELPKKRKPEVGYFTAEQARAFLEQAESDRLFALFLLAIECGLRPEEYLALRWKDVDLSKFTLRVRRVINYLKGGGFVFEDPKTKSGRRSMHISEQLAGALSDKRREQLEERMKAGPIYQDHDLIFATPIGMPLSLSNVRNRHFAVIREAAKLPKIRLYDLRHTTATMMLTEGIHPKVVSERLGHGGVVITLDTYSHVLPTLQKDATDFMARALKKR